MLWADDGRPLAVVEAKRTRKSPQIGQQQAKLYADCLEKQFGRRPVIFYTNGYEHWLWDDAHYPPRAVQGFLKKAELELTIQRREIRKSLADAPINGKIVERYYQERAIRRIAEAFEKDHDRKALVVMATGAGKTRTVIALAEKQPEYGTSPALTLRDDVAALLHAEVAAMNLDNFIVRPKRRLIEKYAKPEAWAELPPDAIGELGHEVAGLLYESPFTDVTPRGPDGIFTTPQVRDLLATLDEVRSAALAA